VPLSAPFLTLILNSPSRLQHLSLVVAVPLFHVHYNINTTTATTTQQQHQPQPQTPVTMASALRADGAVVTESEYPALGLTQTLTRVVSGEQQVYKKNHQLLSRTSSTYLYAVQDYVKSCMLPRHCTLCCCC